MLVWAIYDISDNKVRRRIVKICKNIGLYRVQKSVFLGDIDKNNLDELSLQSKDVINEETDSVYIFQMCKTDFENVILIGQAFDKKMVSDEVLENFF